MFRVLGFVLVGFMLMIYLVLLHFLVCLWCVGLVMFVCDLLGCVVRVVFWILDVV